MSFIHRMSHWSLIECSQSMRSFYISIKISAPIILHECLCFYNCWFFSLIFSFFLSRKRNKRRTEGKKRMRKKNIKKILLLFSFNFWRLGLPENTLEWIAGIIFSRCWISTSVWFMLAGTFVKLCVVMMYFPSTYSTKMMMIRSISVALILLLNGSGCHGSKKWRKKKDIINIVIITWTREKPSEKKNNSDITVIWVSNWFKWASLFKISSLIWQFPTNKRTISLFCCFLFDVFNNC